MLRPYSQGKSDFPDELSSTPREKAIFLMSYQDAIPKPSTLIPKP
jgi:hypothetical protein